MLKKRKRRAEDDKQKQAFELYYDLGHERNQKKVANLIGVSSNLIETWSNEFNWVKRVEEKDVEVIKKLRKKVRAEVLKTKEDYREIIAEMIRKFKAAVKTGRIKASTVYDLDKLAKLDLLMMGEPTDNEEIRIIFEDVEPDGNTSKTD